MVWMWSTVRSFEVLPAVPGALRAQPWCWHRRGCDTFGISCMMCWSLHSSHGEGHSGLLPNRRRLPLCVRRNGYACVLY